MSELEVEVIVVNCFVWFFIRNHFIRNLVLDRLQFMKLLELQGKSYETLNKWYIEILTPFNVKLYQHNVNITLL